MAYGKIKADAIIYDNNGSDVEKTLASLAAAAPTASPTFTGTPAAPTAAADTNTTQIATTAYVYNQLASATASKADLASPTFSGVPAGPTAAVSTNTTQLATTAFVVAEIADEVGTTVQAFDADTAKTDVAQTYTAAQRASITTLTSGASVTPDFAASNNYTLTLGQNLSIANPTNLTAGQSGSIFLVQDGTGSRTASWGSYWDFAGGTAPTLSTGANVVDRVDYVVRSSTSIHAVATLAYS